MGLVRIAVEKLTLTGIRTLHLHLSRHAVTASAVEVILQTIPTYTMSCPTGLHLREQSRLRDSTRRTPRSVSREDRLCWDLVVQASGVVGKGRDDLGSCLHSACPLRSRLSDRLELPERRCCVSLGLAAFPLATRCRGCNASRIAEPILEGSH